MPASAFTMKNRSASYGTKKRNRSHSNSGNGAKALKASATLSLANLGMGPDITVKKAPLPKKTVGKRRGTDASEVLR